MGSKRVGLARTQALLQGLKRELQMGGATFVSASLKGTSTATYGTGFVSGSTTAPTTRITNVNGEIITTITFDLTNLSSSGVTQKIIGNKEAGVAETSPAYLMQWDTTTNGIMYKAELSCIELPACAEGDPTIDFDVEFADTGTSVFGADPAGNVVKVITGGGNFAQGTTMQDLTVGDVENDQYLYLIAGAAQAQGTQYTAGKFIFRFYGYPDF